MRLNQSQLEQLIQSHRLSDNGKNINGICPFCGHDEFGISIYLDNHPYNCYRKKSCGEVGNIYTLLKHLGKSREFLGDREVDPDGQLSSLIDDKVIEDQEKLIEIEPPAGWRRVNSDDYLEERGFNEQQFKKFKVGRSVFKKDYVTFLVEMNGVITGYISRSVRSKSWIDAYNDEAKKVDGKHYLRYQNSVSDFSRMLFGYDEINGDTTDVILVEGIFSKTKTDLNLDLDSVSWMKCCATFGAKVSDEQIRLLKEKGIKTIWLWFEADVLDKIKQIAAKLSLNFDVKVSFLNGFDPGDIDELEAMRLLENSVNFIEIDQNYL